MRSQRPIIDGFEVIGGLPEFGSVDISYDTAREIRDFTFGSLLTAVNKISLAIDDLSCKTKFGVFMQSEDYKFDIPSYHSYLSARMEQSDYVDWWKLTIARVVAAPGDRGVRRITHKIESINGELCVAKKQFKYIDRQEIVEIGSDEIIESVIEKRKMYERSMRAKDANDLLVCLEQTTNRIRATRGNQF